MKRILLGTTALAFAGAMGAGQASAADMLSVNVGGFMEQWVGMSSVENTANPATEGGVAQQSDSEIHFKGKLESDSGLTFSVKVELEGNSDSGPIDESQLTVGGSFGQITLGAEDGASVLTHHGVRDAGIGITCGDIGNWINGIKSCGPGGIGTAGHGLGDRNLISYFTPRMEGVQVAATYIPNSGQEAGKADLNNNDHDAWSIGGNYKGNMGDASIAVSAGHYQRSQTMKPVGLMSGSTDRDPDNLAYAHLTAGQLKAHKASVAAADKAIAMDSIAAGLSNTVVKGSDAASAIKNAEDMMASKTDAFTVSNFGLQVGFGAFSFDVAYMVGDGGAYKPMAMNRPVHEGTYDPDGDGPMEAKPETTENNDPSNDIARSVLVKDTSQDFETVTVGTMYTDGPMAISLSYSMTDADDGATQSGTLLSGSYALAPGVAWKSSVFMAERDNANGSSVEGTGFVTGIIVGF